GRPAMRRAGSPGTPWTTPGRSRTARTASRARDSGARRLAVRVRLVAPQPLAFPGLERPGRGDEPPVDRQEVRLGRRPGVGHRDPQEHLALPAGVADRPAQAGLLVTDGLGQLGALVHEADQLPVEKVDPGPEATQLGAVRSDPPAATRAHASGSAKRFASTSSASR